MKTAVASLVLLAGAFAADNADTYRADRVAANYTFVEGPAWSRDGELIFSDIPQNKIFRWHPGRPAELFRENSGGADGNAFDAHGRLYTCEGHNRRVTRTDRNGKTEVLADNWAGKKLNEPNDIVVRHDGHAWFTDPAFGSADQRRELDFYGVYHLPPKGGLDLVVKSPTRPNGIALSPDGRILYITDSDARTVRAWDLDRAGDASNERVLVSGIAGVPGGLRVDEAGNLYVAAREIYIYSPDGRMQRHVPVPETPSNCAFGDADLQSLFVTARTSIYRIRVDVRGALPY